MEEMTTEQRDADATAGGKRRLADQKLGSLLTNKYLVTALLSIVISMGGYIFHGFDTSKDVQAATLSALRDDLGKQRTEIAEIKATQTARDIEIIRRLDRIERNMDAAIRRTRSEAP